MNKVQIDVIKKGDNEITFTSPSLHPDKLAASIYYLDDQLSLAIERGDTWSVKRTEVVRDATVRVFKNLYPHLKLYSEGGKRS